MGFTEFIQSRISDDIIHQELQVKYRFYRNLTPELKERFVKRTSVFIENKKFVARKDLVMTDTIRIIVSACAVQVTFGLDSFTLDTFEHVVIYPDIYESPVTKQMHKGETNLNGFICLSWKDILAGIENPTDNYNLGLHEWTHALRFNGFHFQETDYFFDNYINKWVSCSMIEFNKLKGGKESIFRRYGATNIHEFLSVTTEHFFESPDEFKLKAPEFFNQMCILFNQLPANEGSVKINVRNELLIEPLSKIDPQAPILELKASFLQTLISFGVKLIYFVFFILFMTAVIVATQSIITLIIGLLILPFVVIKLNNTFVTVKFYETGIYVQKGFTLRFARKLYVNYHALTKMTIYKYRTRNYSSITAIEMDYYDGKQFRKESYNFNTNYIPQQQITDLMEKKQVLIVYPKE